ncbi:MAG TPA: CorA family divalent cation transporter [Myxococcota bacterium]|nr:CorA family divalent cation transporter [Myxococcota bacterium]
MLPPTWSLPDALTERLGSRSFGRQRAIVEGGHLLLVLHLPPGPDDDTRQGALFWRSPAGEWQASRGSGGAAALLRHVAVYEEVEDRLSERYESTRDTLGLFGLVEALVPVARAARNLHQTLQTAREVVRGDKGLLEARDAAYEVSRNLDLLLEDARNAIQHMMARDNEAQAQLSRDALRASHRLNVLAALTFPLTALSSLFGMNFAHGLPSGSPLVFWLVTAAGVGLGLGLKRWVTAPTPPGEVGIERR